MKVSLWLGYKVGIENSLYSGTLAPMLGMTTTTKYNTAHQLPIKQQQQIEKS